VKPPEPLPPNAPGVLLSPILVLGDKTHEGQLVVDAAVAWFKIIEMIRRDPESIYGIGSRKWEEIVAGAYDVEGFKVTLTPRSGDGGRDVIAERPGVGSVRFLDQVKAYRPGHLVTAEEVRAMLGVLYRDHNASKALVTTTSDFAPRLREDDSIKPFLPNRLELKPRDVLLPWLDEVSAMKK
jgi:restriction system protein